MIKTGGNFRRDPLCLDLPGRFVLNSAKDRLGRFSVKETIKIVDKAVMVEGKIGADTDGENAQFAQLPGKMGSNEGVPPVLGRH